MAESFGIALAVVTASIGAAKSLFNTVERYKGRNRTLERLCTQLTDLLSVLEKLAAVAQSQSHVLELLQSPVERCQQLCDEFERTLEDFGSKPKASLLDWAKMEFKKGDINEFMDTLSGYKSTMLIGLGTITLQEATATKHVLEQYSSLVEATTEELHIQLQRINERLDTLPNTAASDFELDLKDEKAVIEHCIRVCENGFEHVTSLSDREEQRYARALESQARCVESLPSLDASQTHQRTRDFLEDSRDRFAQEIGRLQERLANISQDGDIGQGNQRAQLQRDIKTLEKSLEICKLGAGEVSRQRIHTFGEVIAEGDSDQVVVTTLADLFDIRKAISKGQSAQLIGTMSDEALMQLSRDRYGSRFATAQTSRVGSSNLAAQKNEFGVSRADNELIPSGRAVSNETRKRSTVPDTFKDR